MKKTVLLLLAIAFATTVARAQNYPAADLTVGYSMIDVVKGPSQVASGGEGSIAFNCTSWLAVAGDIGVYSASPNLTAITYTAGPRVSYRHWERMIPFAQVLFGGAHASSSAASYNGATNAYALGAGGGAEFVLDRGQRFVLRPQLEYFGFGTIGSVTDTIRLSVGIVFRIPKRK